MKIDIHVDEKWSMERERLIGSPFIKHQRVQRRKKCHIPGILVLQLTELWVLSSAVGFQAGLSVWGHLAY